NPPPVMKSQGTGTQWALAGVLVTTSSSATSALCPITDANLDIVFPPRASRRCDGLELRIYWIPAVAEATTTSATPRTVASSAFAVVPAGEDVTSLITTWPPGIATAWFGAPVTATGTPLICRPLIIELPLP